MNKLFSGLILFLSFSALAQAQIKEDKSQNEVSSTNISGIIYDAKTKQPIPFVHVGVKGKNVGVISLEDGSFSIIRSALNPKDSLSFSSVGYQTYTRFIDNTSDLEILLFEDIKMLREVLVEDTRELIIEKFGRTEISKTTNGATNAKYGWGQEFGIKIQNNNTRFVLEDINFHMLYNTTDSILFRINIYKINEHGLPGESLLGKELYMKSYRGKKWISRNFYDEKVIIDQDVIVSYEIIRIWLRKNGQNNVFFTYGKGYPEGGQFLRNSSFDNWNIDGGFPIALYVTGRIF